MTDIVSPERRSLMMAAIRSRDTKLELLVRRHLFKHGFRYRVAAKGIPGRPDIWFPRRKAAVFIHGCFFHGHTCEFFRLPASRPEFWGPKIQGNRTRDSRVRKQLSRNGVRWLEIWECAFRSKKSVFTPEEILSRVRRWVTSGVDNGELDYQGFRKKIRRLGLVARVR